MMPPPTQSIAAVPTTLRCLHDVRHRLHETSAEPACDCRIALCQMHADVVHLHDQSHHAIHARGECETHDHEGRPLGTSGRSATVASAIAMISPDRIRSVRMAPATFCASIAAELCASCSTCGVSHLAVGGVEQRLDDFFRRLETQVAPPTHQNRRHRPGANALSNRAPGNRNRNLFRSEPSAIFQTMGSSRSGVKPIA